MGATIPDPGPTAIADADDALLVARTDRGDRAAFDELFRRHAQPAWRAALAVGGSRAAAEQAVAEGFTSAFRTRARGSSRTLPFRLLVVRSTVDAASAEAASGVAPVADPAPNPAVAALHALPVRSRAVLWLLAAERGTPPQVAAVLGLDADAVAGIATRATAAMEHQGWTDDPAGRAALRALVTAMPAELATAAAAWWTAWHTGSEAAQRRRIGGGFTIAPLTERIVGTAAAAVLAAGVAAAFALGDRGSSPDTTVALPGNGEVASGAPTTTRSTPPPTVPPLIPPPPAVPAAPAVPHGRLGAAAANADPGPAPAVPPAPAPGAAPAPAATPPAAPEGGSSSPSPTPPVGTATAPDPGATLSLDVAGTPVAVVAGADGTGVQVGDTVVGTPPPTSAPTLTISTGILPTITIPLL